MQATNMKECLVNNLILYRSILTIPKDIKFGIEIELENVSFDDVERLVYKQFGKSWKVKDDRSLMNGANAEIAIPPLFNDKKTWIALKKLSKLIEHVNPTYDHCSFQINLDGSLLPSDNDKLKFMKLYSMYEDIIYRLSTCNNFKYRDSIVEYAYPILLTMKRYNEEDILSNFKNQKRYGINFKTNNMDLIEFRTPNSTSNPILWQNFITFFYYLVMYSKSSKCDIKELESYIDSYNNLDILEEYKECKEEKAFQLSKKIFKNQEDQIHFLSHYIGY